MLLVVFLGPAVLKSEQFFDSFLLQANADDTDHAGGLSAAISDFGFTRYIVEVQPLAVFTLDDTLRAEHLAVFREVGQLAQSFRDLVRCELVRGIYTELIEDLIRMVVVVIVVMMVVVFVVMIMIVVMVVMIVVVVVMVMIVVMVVVIMIIVVVVMVIIVVMVIVVVVMVMIVVMVVVIMVMIVVMMLCFMSVSFFTQLVQFCGESLLLFHGLQDALAGNLIPRCGYDRSMVIVLAQQFNHFVQLFL